ncbi:MAG: hypothetical protein IJQ82_09070 [Selenomonadaceae bacterium]|nr:hypothetical protein [Selenomonadaceae bacterium]
MDNYERKPFEERLIAACKEIKLMEADLMPKQTWEEFLEELEEERRQEFDGNNLVGAF